MSPEQALAGSVDVRSDIFSLGVVLYEMVAGRHPFAAADIEKTLVNVTGAVPPVPEVPGGSEDLSRLISRAMAKEIERRPASAPAFASDLRRMATALDVRAGEPPRTELLPLDDERGTGVWWGVAAGLAALAAVLWWFL
jgi:serine/threonine protein kinase